MRFILDPGHGGPDPGAVGGWLTEAQVVLDIALRVVALLQDAGHEAILTREDDTKPKWRDRIAPATAGDRFISIHCNASNDPSANGMETFHFPGSTGGRKLAEAIFDELRRLPNLKPREVKSARFYVLRKTPCPAALVECAFISNLQDRKFHLESDAGRQRLAGAIAKGAIKGGQ